MSEIIGNIQSVVTVNNVLVKSTKSIYSESFYFQDFYDEARIQKFEKSVKELVRKSREYDTYLAMLKSNCSMMSFDNVQSRISSEDCSIEMHHYPFTIEDIVEIVFNHHVARKEKMTTFSLAKEIMELHYKHNIGLVPLDITNHEMAHTGDIFISNKQIFGNWRKFMEDYKDGISVELSNKVKRLDELSEKNVATDYKGLLS
jgi:hypothetical protein